MKNKEIFIGIGVGIITTIIGVILYVLFKTYTGDSYIESVWRRHILSSGITTAIAWGTALNFAAFFGFLKLNKEDRAQGVLIITVIAAVGVMIQKLLS